jgi:hypothetical protein
LNTGTGLLLFPIQYGLFLLQGGKQITGYPFNVRSPFLVEGVIRLSQDVEYGQLLFRFKSLPDIASFLFIRPLCKLEELIGDLV